MPLCQTGVIRTSPPESGLSPQSQFNVVVVTEYPFFNFSPFECMETLFYRLAYGLPWTMFHVCVKGMCILLLSGRS